MKLKSDRKNYVIMALCAILLVMSIGYAAFSSLLTINGTASVSDSFCVGFDNTKTNTYAPTAGISGGTLPTGSITYSGTACSTNYQPNSSLSATFKQPGDKIEYTLTIANKSTFTVAIESILVENQNVTSNTTITKGNIKYIVEMPLTTTLASNAETTMKITAMFQNNTDVTGQYSGESQTINVKINAQQGDSGFTPTSSTFTGTIYRNDNTPLINGVPLRGEAMVWYPSVLSGIDRVSEELTATQANCELIYGVGNCSSGTVMVNPGNYTNDPSELNEDFYLKHTIVNDIVTASYVCFTTDTEHCMQGGNSSYYSDNLAVLQSQQSWFVNHYGGCSFGSKNYCEYMIDRGLGYVNYEVSSDSSGHVYVDYGNHHIHCNIYNTGVSRCLS